LTIRRTQSGHSAGTTQGQLQSRLQTASAFATLRHHLVILVTAALAFSCRASAAALAFSCRACATLRHHLVILVTAALVFSCRASALALTTSLFVFLPVNAHNFHVIEI
jgi:hypothetical protein